MSGSVSDRNCPVTTPWLGNMIENTQIPRPPDKPRSAHLDEAVDAAAAIGFEHVLQPMDRRLEILWGHAGKEPIRIPGGKM